MRWVLGWDEVDVVVLCYDGMRWVLGAEGFICGSHSRRFAPPTISSATLSFPALLLPRDCEALLEPWLHISGYLRTRGAGSSRFDDSRDAHGKAVVQTVGN